MPVIYDPQASAAWRDTPGLHTLVRSLVAAALLAPAVFVPTAGTSPSRLSFMAFTQLLFHLTPPTDVEPTDPPMWNHVHT